MPHPTPSEMRILKERFRRIRKQTRRFFTDHGWLMIGLAAISVFILGLFGFRQLYLLEKKPYTWLDLIHMSFGLFKAGIGVPLGPKPWLLEFARTLASIITLTAAIKALMLFFQEKLQQMRLWFWRNHVVICGLGEKGQQLALNLLERGEQVVVIDQNAQNDKIRRLQEQGAVVLVGNAARKKQLLKAKTERARYLFVVTPDDWSNLEIALRAHELMAAEAAALPAWRSTIQTIFDKVYARTQAHLSWLPSSESSETSRRHCFVHLVDNELHQLFAHHRIFSWVEGPAVIKSFNIYENSARQLFSLHPYPEETATKLKQDAVHLLLIGFGRMGRSLALQIARIGHYAQGRVVRITVLDKSADNGKDRILGQYPAIEKICAFNFINLDTESREFLNGSFLAAIGGAQSITQAIVCLEQESMVHACALHLLRLLHEVRCPIFVRVNTDTHLIRLLGKEHSCIEANDERLQRIHPFGSIAATCSATKVMNDEINKMAKQFHASYREVADRLPTDPAMKPWEELDEDYKESNRAQADHLEVKLRAVGCKLVDIEDDTPVADFSEDEIELLAKMEHARWNAERFLAGWTWVLADRNLAKKTSPFLVDWDELDDIDKKLNIVKKPTKEYDRDTVRELAKRLATPGIRKKIVRVQVSP